MRRKAFEIGGNPFAAFLPQMNANKRKSAPGLQTDCPPYSPAGPNGYRRVIRSLAAAVLSLPVGASAADVVWDQDLYNPRPLQDDVIFPLPCGGAIAFRPVDTRASGPMDDQLVELGGNAEDTGYLEHPRVAFVAGPFHSPSPTNRRLLIGKYEVNELQYAAVLSEASGQPCPDATGRGRMPRTHVGWHDAAGFAHEYSLWLREQAGEIPDCSPNHSPCLPREDGVPAFVRLPTETEWELAARGGSAVSPADFRESTYPMPDGIARHVWFNETADGNLKPIGLLEPNPLGLHDILGNAEEILLEPFRLSRLDRLHGQPGGYVVRGGSVHSDRKEIRTSLRREVPFYDDRGAVKTGDTGFRLAASVPVIRSQSGLKEIRSAWVRLGSTKSAEPGITDEPFEDPILELSALARAQSDPETKKRLEQLRSRFLATAQRLYDQRNRSARETLSFGGLLCQKLHDEGHNIGLRRKRQRLCIERQGPDHRRCRRGADALAANEKALTGNALLFADTVVRTAQNHAEDIGLLADQLQILADELENREIGHLAIYPRSFHSLVLKYSKDGRVRRDTWYDACVKLKEF